MKPFVVLAALLLGVLISGSLEAQTPKGHSVWEERIYQRAVTYGYSERTEEATELLALIYPYSPEADHLMHDLLVKDGKSQAADELLAELYRLYPHHSVTVHKYLLYLLRENRIEDALRTWEQADNDIRQTPSIRLSMADALLRKRSHISTVKSLLNELNPDALTLQERKAYLFCQLMLSKEEKHPTRETFLRALDLFRADPQDNSSQWLLAQYLQQESDYKEIKKELRTILPEIPLSNFLFNVLEKTLSEFDFDWSVEILDRIYQEDQATFIPVFSTIVGLLYQNSIHPIEMLPLYEKYLPLAPKESLSELISVWLSTASIAMSQEGFWKEYLKVFSAREDAREPSSIFLYEQMEEQNVPVEKRLSFLKDNLALFPNSGTLTHIYSTLLLIEGQTQEALELLLRFLDREKEHDLTETHLIALQIADIYAQEHDDSKALQYYEDALRRKDSDPLILNNYASFLSQRKMQIEKALPMAAKAANLLPDNANIQDTYGVLLLQKNNAVLATIYLRKAVDLMEKEGGKKSIYYQHYGDALYLSGQKEEAEKVWKKGNETTPSPALELRLSSPDESLTPLIQKSL